MRSSRATSIGSVAVTMRFSTRPSVPTSTASSLPARIGTNSMWLMRATCGSGAAMIAACWVSSDSRRDAFCTMSSGVGPVTRRRMSSFSLGDRPRTLSSDWMKKRRPCSVGTRPAEVWRCSRRPSSSRSAITLRTVAGDRPISWRRVTVRDPTASPLCRYSATTACKILRARRDSSVVGIVGVRAVYTVSG